MKKPSKNPSKQSPQEKFSIMREEMSASLIERSDEIDVVLTALICGEHPLLVGPPGTAKSFLLDSLMEWMGNETKKFSILFNKFTTPEEVFGPISVQGLKNDQYRRITTGKLPEAEGAFVDEIFKASTAILNTMLRILNERVYENGDGTYRKVPLRICVAASNEWPNDQEGGKELGALFDRFLFRKTVRPIQTHVGRDRLLWKRDHKPQLSTAVTGAELDLAHDYAAQLEWSDDAKQGLIEILDQLAKEGIRPGDRRMYKSVFAVQAYAFLCGVTLDDMIQRENLEILAHVLWDDPTEQPEKCARIVARTANPVAARINEFLSKVQDILAKNTPENAVPKLKEVQREMMDMPVNENNKERMAGALDYVSDTIRESYNKAIGVYNG